MCKITVIAALVLSEMAYCQFGFSGFGGNQQQGNPFSNFNPQQRQFQAGFQQSNFAFPQNDFVFPNFSPQNQRPNQRPQNNNNFGQQLRPQNNNFGQQQQGGAQRPKPTFAPKFTTVRPGPLSFAPQLQSGTLQVNRLDERISQTKCTEYSNYIKRRVQVASLSLDSSAQDIQVVKCDAVTGLIVGGVSVAKTSDFPHMAAIGYADFNGGISFKCGASLISELFVLSVAHCQTADRTPASVIRLGDLNLKVRDVNSPEVDIPIALFISHEAYNKDTRENDIAVIKMSQPAVFSANIRPACLQFTNNLPKTNAIATGWGYTEVGGIASDTLQKVKLDIVPNDVCSSLYNDEENYHIYPSQVCAGDLKGGKDTCGGDSGGPLVQTIGSECVFSIIGLTSYGSQYCGSKNSPGIYTRVSSYMDWIELKVWGQ